MASAPRRIVIAALAALIVGLGGVSLAAGLGGPLPVRVLKGLAVFGAGAVILGGTVVLVLLRLGGWRDPVSEQEFDAIVERAERLAAAQRWEELGEDDPEPPDADPERCTDAEFRALVRAAIDELPLEFHRALEHVAIVVSDGGAQRGAYGLYEGDTVARDYFHERIVIFRDTLMRDFGHNPEQLKAQVVRTVRHELAHHLGWDEKGVRRLGL